MSDIAFHITDVVNNSLRAGADRIGIELSVEEEKLTIVVSDNGCGMTPEALERLADPFFTSRTERHVGLGIPLLYQSAEMSGGSVTIRSRVGCGTRVEALFLTSHPDCPPAGDIPDAVALLISGSPDADISIAFNCQNRSFKTSSRQLSQTLGQIPLWLPAAASAIHDFIASNFAEVFAGILSL